MVDVSTKELHVFKKVIITSVVAAVATLGAAGIAYADTEQRQVARTAPADQQPTAPAVTAPATAAGPTRPRPGRDSDSDDATSGPAEGSDRYNTDTTAAMEPTGPTATAKPTATCRRTRRSGTHKYSLLGGL